MPSRRKTFQHKRGISEPVRKRLAAELALLCDQLRRAGIVDKKILMSTDRLCRRLFADIDPGWVLWSYHCQLELFGGDFEKYKAWAQENCEPLPGNPVGT